MNRSAKRMKVRGGIFAILTKLVNHALKGVEADGLCGGLAQA